MKFRTGIEPTLSLSVDVCPPFLATKTVEMLSFAPLKYAWKKRNSSDKASEIYYMGDLNLQLPSTDLHLDLGMGGSMCLK